VTSTLHTPLLLLMLRQGLASNSFPRRIAKRTYIRSLAAADPMATQVSQNKQFGGINRRFKHASTSCGCDMQFTVFFPPAAETSKVWSHNMHAHAWSALCGHQAGLPGSFCAHWPLLDHAGARRHVPEWAHLLR
jgi:hypothetical protein